MNAVAAFIAAWLPWFLVGASAIAALFSAWWIWGTQVAIAFLVIWWPWLVIGGAAAVILLVVFFWWLWWRLPKWQVDHLGFTVHDRADTEDNFRKTIGQLLGGVAVLAGEAFAYLQFTQQQETAREQLRTSVRQIEGATTRRP